MSESQQLLSAYVQNGSEQAFEELVKRYLGLVYSTATRMLAGDSHLAEDVAQTVFLHLAQKAETLPSDVMLGGWLHRDTCFVASKLIRKEQRRRLREQQAAEMKALSDHHDDLSQLAPILDDAVNGLREEDRRAILLRFYERLDFRAVGDALGSSENAAQKRVSRALEQLHLSLTRQGVGLSAAALGAALASETMTAAPAGLSVSITGAVLSSVAGATGTKLTLLNFLAMTKLKTGLAVIALLATTTGLFFQHRSLSELRSQNLALSRQVTPLLPTNENAPVLRAEQDEMERLRKEHSELMRLRGEVTGLKREAEKLHSFERELAIPPGASRLLINNPYLARASWSDKGTDSPYHALETMLSAGLSGDTQRLAEVTIQGENSLLPLEHTPVRTVKGVQIVSVDGDPTGVGVTRIGAIVEDEYYGGGLSAPPGTVQTMRFWFLVQTNGEWKVTGEKVKW